MTDAFDILAGRSFTVREFLLRLDQICDMFDVSLIPQHNMHETAEWIEIVDNETDEVIGKFY